MGCSVTSTCGVPKKTGPKKVGKTTPTGKRALTKLKGYTKRGSGAMTNDDRSTNVSRCGGAETGNNPLSGKGSATERMGATCESGELSKTGNDAGTLLSVPTLARGNALTGDLMTPGLGAKTPLENYTPESIEILTHS